MLSTARTLNDQKDTASKREKSLYFVKSSVDVNGWPRYQTAKKNCRKFQPADRVCESYRQTDDRRNGDSIYSEREREFTFAKNEIKIR